MCLAKRLINLSLGCEGSSLGNKLLGRPTPLQNNQGPFTVNEEREREEKKCRYWLWIAVPKQMSELRTSHMVHEACRHPHGSPVVWRSGECSVVDPICNPTEVLSNCQLSWMTKLLFPQVKMMTVSAGALLGYFSNCLLVVVRIQSQILHLQLWISRVAGRYLESSHLVCLLLCFIPTPVLRHKQVSKNTQNT